MVRWMFTVRVDPERLPTDVVLEIGSGPASRFTVGPTAPVAQDLSEAAALEFVDLGNPRHRRGMRPVHGNERSRESVVDAALLRSGRATAQLGRLR